MDNFKQKTLFEQWLSPISSKKLDKLVEAYHLNYYTKKLHLASFLKLLLFAQLNEAESLRAISDALFSEKLQKATGLQSISFSQLVHRLNKALQKYFKPYF